MTELVSNWAVTQLRAVQDEGLSKKRQRELIRLVIEMARELPDDGTADEVFRKHVYNAGCGMAEVDGAHGTLWVFLGEGD